MKRTSFLVEGVGRGLAYPMDSTNMNTRSRPHTVQRKYDIYAADDGQGRKKVSGGRVIYTGIYLDK